MYLPFNIEELARSSGSTTTREVETMLHFVACMSIGLLWRFLHCNKPPVFLLNVLHSSRFQSLDLRDDLPELYLASWIVSQAACIVSKTMSITYCSKHSRSDPSQPGHGAACVSSTPTKAPMVGIHS